MTTPRLGDRVTTEDVRALPVGAVMRHHLATYTKEGDDLYVRRWTGGGHGFPPERRTIDALVSAMRHWDGTAVLETLPPAEDLIEEATPELTLAQYQQRLVTIVMGEVYGRVSRSAAVVRRGLGALAPDVEPSIGMCWHRWDTDLHEDLGRMHAVVQPIDGDTLFTVDGTRLLGTGHFDSQPLCRVVSLDGHDSPLPWAAEKPQPGGQRAIEEFLARVVELGNDLCRDENQAWCGEYEDVMHTWFGVEVDRDE